MEQDASLAGNAFIARRFVDRQMQLRRLRPPYERRYCDFEKDHDHTCCGWRSRDEYKALRRGAVA